MKKIGDILPDVVSKKKDKIINLTTTVICRKCGNDVVFKGKQYTKYCSKCGLPVRINQSPEIRYNKFKRLDKINCWICLDTGFVQYEAQIDSLIYSFAARCVCPAGNAVGKKIPSIVDTENKPDVESIIAHNQHQYGYIDKNTR